MSTNNHLNSPVTDSDIKTYDTLNPFLLIESFREKYVSVQNITHMTKEFIYLFLAEWLGTPTEKIKAACNSDSSINESSGKKITSRDLTGFSYTHNNINIKVLVTSESPKKSGKKSVKTDNRPHLISFFYNGDCIFTYTRNANGANDLILRRIYSKTNDTIALFVYIILFLSIEFDMHTYLGKRLYWETYESLTVTAAEIEFLLYKELFSNAKSYISREKERLLKNHITEFIAPEHISNAKIINSVNSNHISTQWSVQSTQIRKGLTIKEEKELKQLNDAIAEKIIQTLPRYPLLSSIMQTKNNDHNNIDNIINLLRQICVITLRLRGKNDIEVNVSVRPIIASTLQSFDDAFDFLKTSSRNYTKLDALLFLGLLSEIISSKPDHSLTENEINDFCSTYQSADTDTALTIFNDLKSKSIGILIKNDVYYKFRHKQSRLIFFGIYSGMCENNRNKTITGVELLNKITENASYNQHTNEHIRWKYDNSVIFGCAFLNSLTNNKREVILNDLCQVARNAETKNRDMQEKAIALLSYYLCEGTQYSGKQREMIFHSSYAKDLYLIQETMWAYLRKSTPFYHDTINNNLSRACMFDETGKYACCDPYYIFLGWDNISTVSKDISFFRESCNIQHNSWFGNKDSVLDIENILTKIKAATQHLKQCYKNNILYYVYSLNMLLLSLANIRILCHTLDSHKNMYSTAQQYVSNNSDDLIHAAILCDYYTRKFNFTYNEGDTNCRKTDLFLLSGAIRFLCSYFLTPGTRVNLGEMKSDYIRWYNNESGRWKVLLTRLLSYTDFFIQSNTNFVSKEEYSLANFLEYDNIPKEYSDFTHEVKQRFSN